MEIWQMRKIIKEVYTTYTWHQKVKKMSSKQVIAIYICRSKNET